MRKLQILIPVFMLLITACGKDTFDTRPALTLKSVSTREVVPTIPVDFTPNLVMSFEFTDQEGDLAGALVGVRKEVLNCEQGGFVDTLSYFISQELFETRNIKGTLDLVFPYFKINPVCNYSPDDDFRGDSAVFYVWVRDRAGNTSDTVSTGLIRIGKN